MLLGAVFLFSWINLILTEDRIVSTDQGLVRGYKLSEEDYFVFYGIPYATAPTGPNKFKAPLPPPTFDEPYEAVEKNIVCPQNLDSITDTDLIAHEDCLITNIYVPDTDESNLSVLVYVHGGAYQMGYGNIRTGIHLLNSKKIIIVNFNYRLGPHGLLCLGTKDIPGNAGMKDQVALLRWVQRNIVSFGGNPNDVTIAGWSAGASAVDLVMISKIARGLFHKVIPESGSNTASFSVQVDPIENAKKIARELNFNNVDDLEALEIFYKNATLEDIFSIDVFNEKDSSTVFAPCIERNLGEEMFLDDHPVNILKSGDYPKLPMLYGISNMEGIHREPNFYTWKEMMNQKFSDFLPEDLIFESERQKEEMATMIKQFYFGNNPVSENTILNYVQYFTDVMFGYGTAKAVKLQVEAGNNQIYLYEYSFTDEDTNFIPFTRTRGATHCAQTHAVLDLTDEENLSEGYRYMKKVMRDLWLSFITTGNPVPENSSYPAWPPVGRNRSPYMSLNNSLELRSPFLHHRGYFWDQIYHRHYRAPVLPTPS